MPRHADPNAKEALVAAARAEFARRGLRGARIEDMQGQHTCRADIPGELFGSLIVGTYLLLGIRMSRMQEKPDLATWAEQLHTLIHEGSEPVEFKNALVRTESKPQQKPDARS